MSDPRDRGRSMIGRYVIENELGRGAMGIVYRARDPRLDRLVAVKTLQLDGAVEPEHAANVQERFLNEGRAAAGLRHPNIVAVHDADVDVATGVPYLAMEHVEGTDLKALLAEGIPPEKLLSLLREVAAALDHAHERGIIHRDVKPANVLVDRDGHARLTDFGIARLASSTLTHAGEFLGSPAYMSPEQVRGEPVTTATDVFSLGVVLYEGLTGQRPFGRDDLVSTTHAIAHEQPDPPSRVVPTIAPGFDRVLQRALAKRPEDRQATAGELMREASAALSGAVMDVATAVRPSDGAVTRRPPWWVFGLGAIVVAALVGLATVKPAPPDGEPAPRPTAPTDEPRPLPEAADSPSDGAAGPEVPEPPAESAGEPVPEAAGGSPRDVPATPAPPPPPARSGRLSVELYTFMGGTLVVRDGGRELGRHDVARMRRRGFRIKNPKRRFHLELDVPAGRRTLSFVFVKREGGRLERTVVQDVGAGRVLSIVVDVGTLGRDMDVRVR